LAAKCWYISWCTMAWSSDSH